MDGGEREEEAEETKASTAKVVKGGGRRCRILAGAEVVMEVEDGSG